MSILQDHMRDYLAMRRALGFRLVEAQCHLRSFCAFMEVQGQMIVTAQLALQWATAPANIRPTSWAARLTVVRQFARYLQGFEPRTEVPSTRLLPFRPKRSKPYLYSNHEIRQLMAAAEVMPSRQALRPSTMRMLVGLLAVTGMRVGEALALTREDVDLKNGVLTIRRQQVHQVPPRPVASNDVSRACDLCAASRRPAGSARCHPRSTSTGLVFLSHRSRRQVLALGSS